MNHELKNADLYDLYRRHVLDAASRANRRIEKILNAPLEGNPKLIYADPPKLVYYTPKNVVEYIEEFNRQRKGKEGADGTVKTV